jgi:hypothetical protein
MIGSLIVLKLSLERMNRLSKIRSRFAKSRNKLPMDVWLKISNDWRTAYFDNAETTEELRMRFA